MYATINADDIMTSEEAREEVYNTLANDPTFCGDGGRFGYTTADWFVIGGRWSGNLTKGIMNKEKIELFEKAFEENHGWWTGKDASREDRIKQAKEMFYQFFPNFQGEMPYWRDNYKIHGYEDDAMIITKKIYNKLLKKYENTDLFEGEYGAIEFVDLNYEELTEKAIGNKWLVVVDYHS